MTDTARPGLVNSCLRKQGYPSRAQAERTLRQCMLHRPERKLRVYACDWCQCWHLTGAAEEVAPVVQAPAPVLPPTEPVPMIDVVCKHCHHRFGTSMQKRAQQVQCPTCKRFVPLQPIRDMLANVLKCQEQSEDALRLRKVRAERCVMTSDIATAVGIDRDFLWNWMNGAHPLAPAQLERVRKFMEEVQ